ncbi:MAG: hypothetical protein GX913_02640 [Clostridiales bacterium]|nr:hypothetical protein [Clostridiales bacterium]
MKREVIGILSTEPGCGCTHLSIMLANYLSSVRGYKVCIAEFNENHTFEKLEQAYEGSKTIDDRTRSFYILKTKYFKNIRQEEMPDLLSEHYDYMIIDFGCGFEKRKEEFKRCKRKFIIGSLCDWKISTYIQFLEDSSKELGKEQWEFFSVMGDEKLRRKLEKSYRIQIHQVPFEESPFFIDKKNLSFFGHIL